VSARGLGLEGDPECRQDRPVLVRSHHRRVRSGHQADQPGCGLTNDRRDRPTVVDDLSRALQESYRLSSDSIAPVQWRQAFSFFVGNPATRPARSTKWKQPAMLKQTSATARRRIRGSNCLVTAIFAPFGTTLSTTTVALAHLLVVLFVATGHDIGPAIVASVLGMLCFNFFFLPPLYFLRRSRPTRLARPARGLYFVSAPGQRSGVASLNAT
jgi:hypothetical protein